MSEIGAAYGLSDETLEAIESAAGRYARQAQITEQGFAGNRDLAQTSINREMCNRQAELAGLIQANNAGPQ